MKILILTTPQPGLRYIAHANAVLELLPDSRVAVITGEKRTWERIKFNLGLLRKGIVKYYKRRKRIAGAADKISYCNALEKRLLQEQGWDNELHTTQKEVFTHFSKELCQFIHSFQPDYLLQAGVGIIPGDFIRKNPPILNLHPGILPGIRGVDPQFWARYNGRKDWMGSTLHLVSEKIDAGQPLLRKHLKNIQFHHFIHDVPELVKLETEMLKLLITHGADECKKFDEGGSSKSVYRSYWSKEQYEELESKNWWNGSLS